MSTRGRTPAGRTATDKNKNANKQMIVHTEADAGAGHGKDTKQRCGTENAKCSDERIETKHQKKTPNEYEKQTDAM